SRSPQSRSCPGLSLLRRLARSPRWCTARRRLFLHSCSPASRFSPSPNTALVNYVTASRLIYGMAHQSLLPLRLGEIHADRRTPHIAIAALFLVAAPLAFFGTIAELAAAHVLLLLLGFSLVDGALFGLQRP